MEVGQEIRRLREAKNLSQTKVAAFANMSVSGLSQIETGARNPSAVTLEKLARALDVEVADLFPKAEAPLPFDEPDEEALEARRVQAFQSAVPSEEERVRALKGGADILYGYTDRWRIEVEKVEKDGTYPYGKSIEMRTLREKLSDALKRDGIWDYVGWVETGRLEVSDEEREAALKVVDGLLDMFNVVGRMHEIEHKNRRRAGEDAEELERLDAEFAATPDPGKLLDGRGLN